MSKRNPKNNKTGIPESVPAASPGPIRCRGEDSIKDHVNGDRQIVDRCLSGDKQAWEGLYKEFHPRLQKGIQLLLGSEAANVHIIDEIAARVWYALLRDDLRLLGTYDADRESTLDGFLMGLARIEILRYTRAERRRHQHEMRSGRRRLQERRVSEWQLSTMMDEFVSTLTPAQQEFMERFLTAPAEDDPDPALNELSGICVRVRRHRIRRKLNDFLENL